MSLPARNAQKARRLPMARASWLPAMALLMFQWGTVLVAVSPAQSSSPPPGKNGRPPQIDTANVSFSGVVTDVTKTSITIQGAGERPKKFTVSETLTAGEVPIAPRLMNGPRGPQSYLVPESCMYRLTDLKIGDWVGIRYAYLNGVDIC